MRILKDIGCEILGPKFVMIDITILKSNNKKLENALIAINQTFGKGVNMKVN